MQRLWQLRHAVADFQQDVIHVQCFGLNGAYATAVFQPSAVPLVVTLRGETAMDDHDIYERSRVLRAALRWGFHQAAAVTSCSAVTLSDARRFGLRPDSGTVVLNGVHLDERDQVGDERGPVPGPVPFARAT